MCIRCWLKAHPNPNPNPDPNPDPNPNPNQARTRAGTAHSGTPPPSVHCQGPGGRPSVSL